MTKLQFKCSIANAPDGNGFAIAVQEYENGQPRKFDKRIYTTASSFYSITTKVNACALEHVSTGKPIVSMSQSALEQRLANLARHLAGKGFSIERDLYSYIFTSGYEVRRNEY